MRKKLLSIILVAMLSTNAIPYTAFAENGESGKTTAEEAAEPTSEAETPAVDASPVLKEVIDMSSKGNDIKVIDGIGEINRLRQACYQKQSGKGQLSLE